MTRTPIPELITGTIALAPVVYFGWMVIVLMNGTMELYGLDNSLGAMSLKVSAATLVFIWALFMLITVYCYLVVMDKGVIYLYDWWKARKAKYVCGNNCKGECSGEVDGTPHCPKQSNGV